MHVHAAQVNPYAAMDTARSAQKTEANREAEIVRKELMESSAELVGESEISDDFVVRLEGQGESRGQPKRRTRRTENNQIEREESAEPEETENHLSDWA